MTTKAARRSWGAALDHLALRARRRQGAGSTSATDASHIAMVSPAPFPADGLEPGSTPSCVLRALRGFVLQPIQIRRTPASLQRSRTLLHVGQPNARQLDPFARYPGPSG